MTGQIFKRLYTLGAIVFLTVLFASLVLATSYIAHKTPGLELAINSLTMNLVFLVLAGLLFMSYRRWRETEARIRDLEGVFSTVWPDVFLLADPERRITMCAGSVKRILGYDAQELLHRRIDDLFAQDQLDAAGADSSSDRAPDLSPENIETARGKRKSGETVPLEVLSREIGHRGGTVVFLRDVSERKRMEADRVKLEDQLKQRNALEELGSMTRRIAHDFSNVLSIMTGYAELALLQTRDDPNLRRRLEEIIRAGQRGTLLVEEVRDLTPEDLTKRRAFRPTSQDCPAGSPRILFVDDERPIAELNEELLEKLGYRVVSLTSPSEALQVFRDEPDSYDLVITDYYMPGMTGLDLSREISRARPNLPIILCTGCEEAVTAEVVQEAGIRDVLKKPVVLSDLSESIQGCLRAPRRASNG